MTNIAFLCDRPARVNVCIAFGYLLWYIWGACFLDIEGCCFFASSIKEK
jgi:hypothetical protein